jgi:hypothetical protein
MKLGVSSGRLAIQPSHARPEKSAPMDLRAVYAGGRLRISNDGRMEATTTNRSVSIPKLKSRILATRSHRPRPKSRSVVANASPCMRPKQLGKREQWNQNGESNQYFHRPAGHMYESRGSQHKRDRVALPCEFILLFPQIHCCTSVCGLASLHRWFENRFAQGALSSWRSYLHLLIARQTERHQSAASLEYRTSPATKRSRR